MRPTLWRIMKLMSRDYLINNDDTYFGVFSFNCNASPDNIMYGLRYNRSQFQHKSLFMIVEARFYHGYLLRIVNSRLLSLIFALS